MTLKLKTNRNYSVYEMGCPLRNPSLFTLKFDSLPQFYFLKQLKSFSWVYHSVFRTYDCGREWYQMCLINFKSSLIAKKLELILCSFLSGDVRKLAYGKKKINFWTKTDRIFFWRQSIALDELIIVYDIHFFGTKILSWGIPVWKFQGVDNFSSKIHTETKSRPIQTVRHIEDL